MGRIHPLSRPASAEEGSTTPSSTSPVLRDVSAAPFSTCSLCGATLTLETLRYQVVSPLSGEGPLTVCRTCRRAALGEGYRPA